VLCFALFEKLQPKSKQTLSREGNSGEFLVQGWPPQKGTPKHETIRQFCGITIKE